MEQAASGDVVQVIKEIPWASIRPMPGQPREHFDQTELGNLATSIAAVGQRVPAQVARIDDPRHEYELIDGQRRWHAVQIAGKKRLRCEVVDEPDEDRRYVLSVVANMARMGHHAIEIAVACDRMRRVKDPDTGRPMTIARVAAMLGKSHAYVDQYLTLLRLTPTIQNMIHPSVPKGQRLPFSAAILLARLEPGEQHLALEKIRSKDTSPLKATRMVIDEMLADPKNKKKKSRTHDKFISLKRTLRRCGEDLDLYTDQQFQHLVMARDPAEIARLRAYLERIGEAAGRMLGGLADA